MQLFVFDVDGTLVKSDSDLSPVVVRELNAHLRAGDAVAIASGRPVSGARRYLDQLEPSPYKFCIGANGSVVADCQGDFFGRMGLRYEDYLWIYKMTAAKHRTVYTYIDDSIGTLDFSQVIDMEYSWNRMKSIIDFNKNPLPSDGYITKVVVCSAHEDNVMLEKSLEKKDLHGMRMLRSSPIFLEFLNPKADKRNGVELIRERLNIPKENVHTFGDAMNDYLMIRDFDGTAMGNAIDEVKSVAKRVTKTVSEDGVGYALTEWFSIDGKNK